MCRLFAISSKEPVSPMVAIDAMDVMREGPRRIRCRTVSAGSGGPFEEMKDAPILSGIFSEAGLRRLDAFMMDIGFMTKYKIPSRCPKNPPPVFPSGTSI
jgi:hypothetical protein